MTNENKRIKKHIARIIGNWGVSFFGPLASGSVAETYYDIGLTFEQTVFIAFLSSIFITAFVGFKELKQYGEK